ncbi:RagB/SusD family nutrient uptake outer membrane protein [Wenyingzhuangia sp. 1_MG-2023]|nr:RagB/SusD family nutrient uptake outer membrane protein [Wenyingzhuangia sp. 1_MG-2023]
MKLHTKIKSIIKFSALAFILVLTSCSDDYLEVGTYGTPEVKNYYKSPVDAEQGMISVYSAMNEMYARKNFWASMATDLIFGDIGTDDFMKGGNRVNDNIPLDQKKLYEIPTSSITVEQIWAVNYKGIYYANLILEKVPSIVFEDTVRKQEILAEAHFLRAYFYFDLVNSFGGVPLIEKPLKYSEANLPRATEEATYAFIEDELELAIADLPSRFDKDDNYVGRADKGAALGLMMRVSLYQNKMNQVKTYGEQLFALPYILDADVNHIFKQSGEWGSGSIFEINFSSNTSLLGMGIIQRVSPRSKKGGGFMQAKRELRDAYVVNIVGTDTIRDPRYDATFYTPNDKAGTYGTGWYIRKYSWAPYSDYSSPKTGGNANSANNVRVLRLADAYLMYAESIYQTNPTLAIEYVNKVRKRARESGGVGNLFPEDLPLTLTGDTLRDAIYKERRLELAGEGYRYHDLIRTGRAATVLGPLGFQTGKHEIMPIPYSQIQLAKGVLTQNNY